MDTAPTAPHNHTFLENSWVEDAEWWQGAPEEDSLAAAASGASLAPPFGGGLLAAFLPPPPRPAFLEVPGSSSCDLCGWAWQDGEGDDLQGDLLLILNDESAPISKSNENLFDDTPHEFGLVLALIIVSIVSAVIGAIVMVSVIQCRNRLKNIRSRGVCSLCRAVGSSTEGAGASMGSAETHIDEANKGYSYSRANAVSSLGQQPNPSAIPTVSVGQGMWSWLTARRSRLRSNEPSPHVERHHHCTPENHYTLSSTGRAPPATAMGGSSIVEEALYAELDHRDEETDRGSKSPQYEDPSYQNMGYQSSETDPDGPTPCRLSASSPLSSSSAYYSDLSTSAHIPNTGWEATYEAVDPDQNLPTDVCHAAMVNTSEHGSDLAVIHQVVHEATAVACVGEEPAVSSVIPHPCSLPLTKTVPSDYV